MVSSSILALGRQEQEVRGSRSARLQSKFKTSLGYIASSRLTWAILQDLASKKKKNKTKQKKPNINKIFYRTSESINKTHSQLSESVLK